MPAAAAKELDVLNIALLGAGGHSLACHAPALRRYVELRPTQAALAVLCDLDPQRARRAAAEFGFRRACSSPDDAFAGSEIGAAVSVMPIPAILPMTRTLLAHRVPFTIEKPMGQSLAEARAVCQLVQDAGAVDCVMVSFNRRYDPALTLAMSWLGQQGPVRFVRASMVRVRRTEPDFVWGTGIHLIDAVCHAVGPLELREVVRPRGASLPAGDEDCWRVAVLEGRAGATVVLEIMPDAGQGEEQIRFAGDGYQVDIRTGTVPPWRVRAVKQMEVELDVTAPSDEPACVTNGTYAETAAFLDAAAAGAPLPAPSVRDAMASTELAAQIQGGGNHHARDDRSDAEPPI